MVLSLEWDKQRLLTVKDIIRRLRCSYGYACKLAHGLRAKGWMESLTKGRYLLIGAERGPKGVPEMNPYLIARLLPRPYFFAYRFACAHHGLLTQIPRVIHVAVLRPKRPIELKNMRFEFVEMSRARFFGYQEAVIMGEKVIVSDRERSVLDALDRPELVGGVEAAAQCLFHGSRRMDFPRLLEHLKRYEDAALARRLGYLCELLHISLPEGVAAYLGTQTKRVPAYLGSPKRWGREGRLDKRWSLIVNVPQEELLGEVRIG